MARKKRQEDAPNTGGWINTFADLMNLLLCFFVLLFSMSTVDADKYEQLVTSMTQSINIFDGGGAAIGEGAFVSSGTDQLISISQYFYEFENSGTDKDTKEDQTTQTDGEQNTDSDQSAGSDGENIENNKDSETKAEEKYKKKLEEEQKERTEALYGEIVERVNDKNIEDQITVNMDKKYQYVQISLNGAILFDSGTIQIKKSAAALLSKVGDILKIYDAHMIKIEGHTDNVPISGGIYRNNMWLSTCRAAEVFDYLTTKKGLDPKTLEPTGRGEYNPVASNKTAKGRAQNRRVEMKIYTDK